MDELKRGDQIAFIPDHADGNIQHPDVEFGFVTSTVHEIHKAFCRFYCKGKVGILRTLSNSEWCATRNLVRHDLLDQEIIEALLEQYC